MAELEYGKLGFCLILVSCGKKVKEELATMEDVIEKINFVKQKCCEKYFEEMKGSMPKRKSSPFFCRALGW